MILLTVARFLGSARSSLDSRCRQAVDKPFSFRQLCRSTCTPFFTVGACSKARKASLLLSCKEVVLLASKKARSSAQASLTPCNTDEYFGCLFADMHVGLQMPCDMPDAVTSVRRMQQHVRVSDHL